MNAHLTQALTTLKLKMADQKQKEKQTWGGLLSSSTKKTDSDDEVADADKTQVDASQSQSSSTTQSSITFWLVALVVLGLALLAGSLLVN